MVMKLANKNLILKDLYSKKYKNKIVKPKKGKGSLKEKKNSKLILLNIYIKTYYYTIFSRFILSYFVR